MSSEFNASASHQPFATPQPAPIGPPVAVPTASPPTKPALKSWQKWWPGNKKNHEQHGNLNFSDVPSMFKVSKPLERASSIFRENVMSGRAPAIDGNPLVQTGQTTPVKRLTSRLSFVASRITLHNFATPEAATSLSSSTFEKLDLPQASPGRHSMSANHVLGFGSPTPRTPKNKRPASMPPYLGNSPTIQEDTPTSIVGLFDTPKICTRDGEEAPAPLAVPRNANSHRISSDSLTPEKLTGCSAKSPNVFERLGVPCSLRFKRKNAKLSVRTVETPTGIFGVPLRQSITYANVAISLLDNEGKSYIYGYVPIVVAKCGVYLKDKATNVEGIFRLSGSEKRIKELVSIFDSPDRYGKGLDWTGYTVHDAANVLRRYLNQLPEPIVPLDLYTRFREPLKGHTMQAVGDHEGPQLPDNFNVQRAIKTYQLLITELPPLNRQLLLYILDLLAVFASKSDENRMNSNNLAAIFQPGMLRHPSHDMAPAEYRLSQDVLIFLIENQDHFLIGMRGTAADEQTVHEVQNGGTPPPGTPNASSKSKGLGRSASSASAGADSVRKYGGLRRNVSTSSRHSRQSNGAPSPASPAYVGSLSTTPTGGVHRSNTVPSKKSPGLPSSRRQKNSDSPSPNTGIFGTQASSRHGEPLPTAANPVIIPASPETQSTPTGTIVTTGESSLAPSNPASGASQERLLPETKEKQPELTTPIREKGGFFGRSPTGESEKKAPNKLKKKRIPGSSNPSAQSSTQSLHGQQQPAATNAAPGSDGNEKVTLETVPSADATQPTSENRGITETSRSEQQTQKISRPEDPHHPSEKTLKPVASPASSLHSRSSVNDHSQSDADHDPTAEQKDKRSRWRLSRRREESQPLSAGLTPQKTLGSDSNAAASSSSIGSSARHRKSFTGDTIPSASESTLVSTYPQHSNESGSSQGAPNEEKKGPLGWIRKMRDKIEEREAEKARAKSPPATTDRFNAHFAARGKSIDAKREEKPGRGLEEPTSAPIQRHPHHHEAAQSHAQQYSERQDPQTRHQPQEPVHNQVEKKPQDPLNSEPLLDQAQLETSTANPTIRPQS